MSILANSLCEGMLKKGSIEINDVKILPRRRLYVETCTEMQNFNVLSRENFDEVEFDECQVLPTSINILRGLRETHLDIRRVVSSIIFTFLFRFDCEHRQRV
jgi:hypothetical protein